MHCSRVVIVFMTGRTKPDVLKHALAYAWPPIQPIYGLLSLVDSQMTTVRAVMHYMKALFPEVKVVRDDQSLVVVPKALLLVTLALLNRFQLVKPLQILLVALKHLQLEATHRFLHCRARVLMQDWARVFC